MQKQNTEHIDKNITHVFHFLELKGIHNHELIGSNSIKGMLYANDYDLNQNIQESDSFKVLNSIYKQFLHIFDEAYKNEHYYILDFKNGIFNDEAIRWEYEDMKKGTRTIDDHTFTFQECLLHDDNTLKLDLCFVHNNIFTDINMLYNFVITEEKEKDRDDVLHSLDKGIQEAMNAENYFKVIKRKLNKSIITGKVDKTLLDLINSDYGLMYKCITSLKLVYEMTKQKFKPISNDLIINNLEHIKHDTSHITQFDVSEYLDEINNIAKESIQYEIQLHLDIMINHMEYFFNEMLKKGYNHVIYGGSMGLTMPTLHKMLNNSYNGAKDLIIGYKLDKELSGQRAQVYHNPDTNHLVIAHRGTSGIHDVNTDIKLMLGMKKNNRFKHGKKITDQAINKYNSDNVSIIGHSLGHAIAREANDKHDKELITLNGAVVPVDMMKKQKKNEHFIRSKYDPVSALHTLNPFKNKQNTYTLDNNKINPLKAHSIDVLEDLT